MKNNFIEKSYSRVLGSLLRSRFLGCHATRCVTSELKEKTQTQQQQLNPKSPVTRAPP